jgi:hypothetical protein
MICFKIWIFINIVNSWFDNFTIGLQFQEREIFFFEKIREWENFINLN